MVLVRALVGPTEVTLRAARVEADALLSSHARVVSVEEVSDPSHPGLAFVDLVIPRAAILWYATVERVPEIVEVAVSPGEAPPGEAPPEPVDAEPIRRRVARPRANG